MKLIRMGGLAVIIALVGDSRQARDDAPLPQVTPQSATTVCSWHDRLQLWIAYLAAGNLDADRRLPHPVRDGAV